MLGLSLSKRAELTIDQSWVEQINGKPRTQRAVLKLTTEDTRELVNFLANQYQPAEKSLIDILVIERRTQQVIDTKKAEVAQLEAALGR